MKTNTKQPGKNSVLFTQGRYVFPYGVCDTCLHCAHKPSPIAVSYTHLDVYKRQVSIQIFYV